MAVAVAAANAGFHVVLYVGGPTTEVLRPIRELAREVPTASFVIAHLGYPSIDAAGIVRGWEILDLAGEPNILTTLSGLSMWTPHPHQELSGFIIRVLSDYGSRRVMWGSNFPVGPEAEQYGGDLGLIRRGGWGMGSDDIVQVTSRTAERLWFDM
jgi:predicted TIM-barrel fold metal-dependent hydrolase